MNAMKDISDMLFAESQRMGGDSSRAMAAFSAHVARSTDVHAAYAEFVRTPAFESMGLLSKVFFAIHINGVAARARRSA